MSIQPLRQKIAERFMSPELGVTPAPTQQFPTKLDECVELFKGLYHNSDELIVRRVTVGDQKVVLLHLENLLDRTAITTSILMPMMAMGNGGHKGDDLLQHLEDKVLMSGELQAAEDVDKAITFMANGFLIILVDGGTSALSIGLQGFIVRGLSESQNEVTINGPRESFNEVLPLNMSILRRRMGDTALHFDFITIGKRSRTRVAITYIDGVVPAWMVTQVKERLQKADLQMLLDSSHLRDFLTDRPNGFFQAVGKTDRPDVLLNKLAEGRVGIMVNGTPFALYVPQLFHENFQTVDDYAYPPFYSLFLRVLKMSTFWITLILPGLYVALGTFHPALFPEPMLMLVSQGETATPFPLVVEALLIHIIFEVIREAGIRMPKAIGSAVSLVGALVLGEAAVQAGLITAPMVLLVAITAVGSFVVPGLYEPLSVLRLIFIIAAGIFGIYGVAILFLLTLVNITGVREFGVPFGAPLSPFTLLGQRDTLFRANWRSLGKSTEIPTDMTGSEKPQ
ncbi:MAG: spore germination protein [Oscillospiraceae bacterium]|nr:spore germination protein [Oscillospiraceae bacterium]